MPVDPRSPPARLEDIAARTEPRAIFLARKGRVGAFPVFDVEALRDPAVGEQRDVDAGHLRPDQIADILFTSGTTGRAKGVVLSHAAILATARSINAFVGNQPGDREVAPLPLSHSFGLGRLRCQVLAGGALLLVNGFGAPSRLFDVMERYEASGFSFVPAGLEVILRTTGERLGDFADRLRWVEIGSAGMPLARKRDLMRLLPRTRLCMHYGLTEASRSAFVEFHSAGDEHLASVGRATPSVEFRVVDESGRDVPAGTRGQLMVRSPGLLSSYWHDEALTRTTLVDGWLATGDLGSIDADGWLTLTGRVKDMINVGGREACPTEIEQVLEELPEVAACACVGVADPQGIAGQVIRAFLVAEKGARPLQAAQLVAHLRNRLEPYKIPIRFDWIAEIPRTFNGKIQRSALVKAN